MKKLALITVLALLTLPAFSQDTPTADYAKFQGVWGGYIDEHKNYFIFSDNTFTVFGEEAGDGIINYGDFSLLNDTIKFYFKFGFAFDEDEGWYAVPMLENNIVEMQFIFSGDELILISSDYSIILSKSLF